MRDDEFPANINKPGGSTRSIVSIVISSFAILLVEGDMNV